MSPTSNNLRTTVVDKLWRNNLTFVQLLGLSPLLAVTTSAVNGLALGLATAAVVLLTNIVISLVQRAVAPAWRIPLFILVAAALVTGVDLVSNALFDDLHEALGLYIALIAANCALVAQADTVATRRPVVEATLSGLATGLGALGVLVLLGGLREITGQGTLFAGMATLFGPGAAALRLNFHFSGMLIALLPPGAFFGVAALLALRARLTQPCADSAQ
ncbi:MAG: electron transport complex subunit RsxE [Gammaproteobacteria bacterium]